MPNKKDKDHRKRSRDREEFQDQYARAYEEFRRQQGRWVGSTPEAFRKKEILPGLKNRYAKGTDNKWRPIEN